MRRLISLLLLLLGAGGWMVLRHHRQQKLLHRQLEQLTAVLASENAQVTYDAQTIVYGIEAAAAKNRNQPADIASLQRAEALQAAVLKLLAALRAYGGQLHHASVSAGASGLLQQVRTVAAGHGSDSNTLRRQELQRQVATYADTLRQLGLTQAATPPIRTFYFTGATPAVEALADLTRLESEILACQTHALQRIAKSMEARAWLTHLLVTATAEANVVAPGDTYRARLGLVSYFSAKELKMQMACNGRPVTAGPDGTGLVRFRPPARPGRATWTGTIRLNQNGRDTTFKVVVPYRVARR